MMFGAKIEIIDTFDQVLRHVELQSQKGLEGLAEAVKKDAAGSMEERHGVKPSDKGYAHAPDKSPPYVHTGTLRRSIEVTATKGRVFAGTRYSVVGERGAWLEFGGRPLEPGQKGRKRNRDLKEHPFIGPALDRNIGTFVKRVSGSFTRP